MTAYLRSYLPLTLGAVALICGVVIVQASMHKPNSGQLLLPAASHSATLG